MHFRSVLLVAFVLGMGPTAAPFGLGQDFGTRPNEGPSAVDLIAARCVFCHGAATTLAFSRRILDAGGAGALDLFLAGHHAPDAEARAAIVNFLLHAPGAGA